MNRFVIRKPEFLMDNYMNTTGCNVLNPAQLAETRAAAYAVIANGFRYPDAQWLATFVCTPERAQWLDNLRRIDPEAAEPTNEFCSLLAALGAGDNHRIVQETMQHAYVALFGHSVRGTCPPYELEYGQSEIIQRASELADIAGFYAAFGLELAGRKGDPAEADRPDHLSVEAEFMSVLCAKEAYGLRNGDDALVQTVQQAQRSFLWDHLGRWVPAFAQRVVDAGTPRTSGSASSAKTENSKPETDANATDRFVGQRMLAALGGFTAAFIRSEADRFQLPHGPRYMELRPADPESETTMECGKPDICAPGGGEQLTQLRVVGKGE